jgi:hypothetical protein
MVNCAFADHMISVFRVVGLFDEVVLVNGDIVSMLIMDKQQVVE